MEQEKKPQYKFFERHLIRRQEDVGVEGFAFTKSDFEDLIDSFTPKQDIPTILGVGVADLDRFCNVIYGMKYNETYQALLMQANYCWRSAIKVLARSGNAQAMKQMAEITGIGKEDATERVQINFMSDVPTNMPSDEELLKEQEDDDN